MNGIVTRPGHPWEDEGGSTLVLTALGLAALLSMAALGIDLGMLYSTRTELQRAADAAALAGASAFVDFDISVAPDPARRRALDQATAHTVRDGQIPESAVEVTVIPDSAKVRVGIRHTGGTFFARVFGLDTVPVSTFAAAEAATGGSGAVCVKPLAVPDRWLDRDDDVDEDRVWDESESWVYEPEDPISDRYAPAGSPGATGYGSDHAYQTTGLFPRDYGRPFTIKASEDTEDPTDAPVDSFFFPWVMPSDEGRVGECKWQSDKENGADPYRANLCNCNMATIALGRDYDTENGDMEGPTYGGIRSLIDADPDAHWDPAARVVRSPLYPDNASPRIIKIALFDPEEYRKPGKSRIRFNNFVKVFVVGQDTEEDPVRARFLGFASGVGSPSSSGGTLVKVLRLVE